MARGRRGGAGLLGAGEHVLDVTGHAGDVAVLGAGQVDHVVPLGLVDLPLRRQGDVLGGHGEGVAGLQGLGALEPLDLVAVEGVAVAGRGGLADRLGGAGELVGDVGGQALDVAVLGAGQVDHVVPLGGIDFPLGGQDYILGGHAEGAAGLIRLAIVFPTFKRIATLRGPLVLYRYSIPSFIVSTIDRYSPAIITVTIIGHIVCIYRYILRIKRCGLFDRVGELRLLSAFPIGKPANKDISSTLESLCSLIRFLRTRRSAQFQNVLLGYRKVGVTRLLNHILSARSLRCINGDIHVNVPARSTINNVRAVFVRSATCICFLVVGPTNLDIIWT